METKDKYVGEMTPELLWSTTMNPDNRRLYKITMDDAEEAYRVINLCMGNDVAPRKNFIFDNIRFGDDDE